MAVSSFDKTEVRLTVDAGDLLRFMPALKRLLIAVDEFFDNPQRPIRDEHDRQLFLAYAELMQVDERITTWMYERENEGKDKGAAE